jgi:hypothetical protein
MFSSDHRRRRQKQNAEEKGRRETQQEGEIGSETKAL